MLSPRSALLAVALACGGTSIGCDAFKPAPPVEIDSVGDAPSHFEAKRLSFEGTARGDMLGLTTWRTPNSIGRSRGTSVEMSMHVVPVVPPGWTKDQPVPLWVTEPRRAKDIDAWVSDLAALGQGKVTAKVMDYADRPSGMRKESGWQRAIHDAEERFGIESHPHAPVVMWPEP